MVDFIKKLVLRIYTFIYGINFYISDLDHDLQKDKTLTVRFIDDLEVHFHFYKTEIEYFYYGFYGLKKKKRIIYTVSSQFFSDPPPAIEKIKKLKLHVSSYLFFIVNNDQFIYEYLVNVFLDCLIHEVEVNNK